MSVCVKIVPGLGAAALKASTAAKDLRPRAKRFFATLAGREISSSHFARCLVRRALFSSSSLSSSFSSSSLNRSTSVSANDSPPIVPPVLKRLIDTDDPNFRSLFTPELQHLSAIFRRYNHELRIAGGAVRDLLMGRRPGDVDFATTATPAEMIAIFEAENIRVVHDRGAAHGTLMVRVNDTQNFEVTTSRIHVEEDDVGKGFTRQFTRQFTRDWYLDSCQRDLTINAMFLTLDGLLVDYHRGEEHLREGRIVFVGHPLHRIREDHQRILRYFRFHARFAAGGGEASHDSETLEVLRDEGPGLTKLAGMRIWPEMKKIMQYERAGEEIKTMWSLGLLPYCGLPTDIPESNVEEMKEKFGNSFDLQPQALTSLSPLFTTRAQVNQLVRRTANVSKSEQSLLLWIIAHRVKLTNASMKTLKDLVVDDPSVLPQLLEFLKLENEREKIAEIQEWSQSLPVFPVSAFHLMTRGYEGGKVAHQNLAKLKDIWKAGDYIMSKEDLLSILEAERSG